MFFVYKALYPYVTKEVLMNVTMNLRTLCQPPALSVRTMTRLFKDYSLLKNEFALTVALSLAY